MPEVISLAQIAEPVTVASPRKTGMLGQILIRKGVLDQDGLNTALRNQSQKEVSLGELLKHQGKITGASLNDALAEQWSLGWIDLDQAGPNIPFLRSFNPAICLSLGALPWRQVGAVTVLALEDPNRAEEAVEALGLDPVSTSLVMTDGAALRRTIEDIFSDRLAEDAMTACPAQFSCRNWQTGSVGISTKLALWGILIALLIFPKVALFALVGWIFVMNSATNILRITALWASRKARDKPPLPGPTVAQSLPRISMLVPLHNETEVLLDLLISLRRLDYPRELLDVKLVLEASDAATRNALSKIALPNWIEPVVVPHDILKTKPRAMNFALPFCKGEIIGIYDAEDQPETDQLSKVAAHFLSAPPQVACVQGYLDFYNPRQNWLSRCFTIEYSSWFRVLLRGVQRLGIPIPLGGTTVFFRRDALQRLGAWDAHNVTEDADLGIRLARFGYRCEMIDTTTREEANCLPRAWVKQRSRWLKGYVITWAVHMRDPAQLWRDLGPRGFVGFQVLFLGGITAYLTAPFMWLLWLGMMGVPLAMFDSLPTPVWSVFLGSLLIGQVIMLGVAARALVAEDKRSLMPWVLTLPFYWVLGAFAAIKAVYEVFTNPFYWDKTTHGVSGGRTASAFKRVS